MALLEITHHLEHCFTDMEVVVALARQLLQLAEEAVLVELLSVDLLQLKQALQVDQHF